MRADLAREQGKVACPVCMCTVYSTQNGVYFHAAPDCSGMEDAAERTASQAIAMGQEACPVCKPLEGWVWTTQAGAYYHAVSDCSGMEGATLVRADLAREQGKVACPVCMRAQEAAAEPVQDGRGDDRQSVALEPASEGA